MDNDTWREFTRYGIEGRKIELRSRQIEQVIKRHSELPRETVEIPWRERWRRVIRDLRPRHLWRTHETRVVWPDGVYGVRVEQYGRSCHCAAAEGHTSIDRVTAHRPGCPLLVHSMVDPAEEDTGS